MSTIPQPCQRWATTLETLWLYLGQDTQATLQPDDPDVVNPELLFHMFEHVDDIHDFLGNELSGEIGSVVDTVVDLWKLCEPHAMRAARRRAALPFYEKRRRLSSLGDVTRHEGKETAPQIPLHFRLGGGATKWPTRAAKKLAAQNDISRQDRTGAA